MAITPKPVPPVVTVAPDEVRSRAMPLVGDAKYGSRYRDCALALWSHSLGFRHPATGKAMSFAAMPEAVFPWNGFEYFK